MYRPGPLECQMKIVADDISKYSLSISEIIGINPCPAEPGSRDPDIPCICKQCRSRSVGF